MKHTQKLAFSALLALGIGHAQAAIVANSLPYKDTPDWTDIVFSETSMTVSNSASTLVTSNNRGVWFGWGATYGNTPNWTPGSHVEGNHFSMTASFSSNAADWSAYFFDRDYYADFGFAPTGCNGNNGSCYNTNGAQGVTISHAGNSPTDYASTFIALDLSVAHTYEFLLKNQYVTYRIDGQVVYYGLAWRSSFSNPLLVVGDGSGSTQTGRGSMTLYDVRFDNAPQANQLTSVPLPAASGLFMLGLLGLTKTANRRRFNQKSTV